MLEHYFSALNLLADPGLGLLVLFGVMLGLIFGVLPGLSGLTALAMLLPFVYGMDPMDGLSFMLAAHAAVVTGGAVTSCLFGIPGSPVNVATVIDGYALQQKGKGLYAVGASLCSSALGGIVGAVVLIACLPILKSIVLSFGAPEICLLSLIGISYVAVLGRGGPYRGIFAAVLGAAISMIGYQRITGDPRFWFGSDYLIDGIRIVPLVLGLLSVPEIVSLVGSKLEHKRYDENFKDSIVDGVKEVFKYKKVFLRSSIIGTIVGIIPGVGGETAPYLAYAAEKKKSATCWEDRQVVGVIAPESSSNAKEGGALIPTLALGIPGSASMTLLLGGFLVLGIEPGPDFLTSHMDMAMALSVILAGTNVVAAFLMVPVAIYMSKVTRLNARVLVPLLSVLILVGAYTTDQEIFDIVATLVFGGLGLLLRKLKISRAALVLGFILWPIIETYGYISMRVYGVAALSRPISVVLLLLLVFGISSGFYSAWRTR